MSGAKGNEKPLLDNKGLDDIVYWDEAYADVECNCITCHGEYSFNEPIPEEAYEIECNRIKKCIDDNKALINTADVIASIPPCNALAMLNCSAASRSGKSNPASQIIMRCIEFALNSGVGMFVLENAPRLAGPAGLPLLQQIEKRVNKHPEYSMSVVKTNSLWHGMAQKRERTFVFLWKKASAPIMDFNILLNSIEDITGDIDNDIHKYTTDPKNEYQTFLRGTSTSLTDNFFASPDTYYIRWKLINELFDNSNISQPIGQHVIKLDDVDKWLVDVFDKKDWLGMDMTKERKFVKHIYNKLTDNKGYWGWEPLSTWYPRAEVHATNGIISKNLGHFIHPTHPRVLSFREEARLMGIPDDFKVEKKDMHKITQNVPSFTFAAMIEQSMKSLKDSGSKFVFQVINGESIKAYAGKNIEEALTKKKKYSNIIHNEIKDL